MLAYKALQLIFQPCPKFVRVGGKMQVFGALCSEHPKQTALQTTVVVLQCQIEDGPFPNRVIPKRNTSADVIGKLGHEEGFANLWSAYKQIRSRVKQALNDSRSAVIYLFIQPLHCDRRKIGRIGHPLHLPEIVFCVQRCGVAIPRSVWYTHTGF